MFLHCIYVLCRCLYCIHTIFSLKRKHRKERGERQRKGQRIKRRSRDREVQRESETVGERDVSGLCGGPIRWQPASDFHSLLRWMRSQPDQEQTAAFLLLSLVFFGKRSIIQNHAYFWWPLCMHT